MSTLQIETSRFGTVEVEQSHLLQFVSPILGFEHINQYVVFDHAENSPFKWLQAVGDPDLAFVITNPKFFEIPYEFALPEDAVEKLGVEKAEDVLVFTIVNIPDQNPSMMTANLLAPIVINQVNFKGMQVILQDPKLSTRTRLLSDTPAEQGASAGSSSQQGKG